MQHQPRETKSAFALLIGIQDYRAYDPSGKSDLLAGAPDAGAFYRACRRLGIPGENIHILTSPRTTIDKFAAADGNVFIHVGGVGHFGEADNAGIRSELEWLARKLAHAQGDAGAPIGLLSYSGHGALANGELAICPSDVRDQGGVLEGAITFEDVESILGDAAQNLTIVLDCCHAGAAVTAGDPSKQRAANAPLTTTPPPADLKPAIGGARLLMAATGTQTAYQSMFDGRHHGALTWATTVVLEQWTMMRQGDVDYETITYENLRDRAQKLLNALSFGQTVMLAPESAASVPFFHRGKRNAGDVVSGDPDRERHPIQLDPNEANGDYTLYTLVVTYLDGHGNSQSQSSQALSVGSSSSLGYTKGTEYWNLTTDFINACQSAFTAPNTFLELSFFGATGHWADLPGSGWTGSGNSPTMASGVTWALQTMQPTMPFNTAWVAEASSNTYGVFIGGAPAAPAVDWYILASAQPRRNAYVVPPTGLSFDTKTPPSPQQGQAWYTPSLQRA
jgi:Caspase domain